MPTALIVGASRGIGLELAQQYVADGWNVHTTVRPGGSSDALARLNGVRVHQVDVRQQSEIDALAGALGNTPLDLFIHNAGVFGPRQASIGNLDPKAWLDVLEVNTVAPIKVAEALLENVLAGGKKMAFLSSRMGSIGGASGGEYIYRSSKAALNAAVRNLAIDLQSRGLIAAVFHPGWVQTEMGGPGATLTVQESVQGLRQVIAGLGPAQSGGFRNYDGTEIPW